MIDERAYARIIAKNLKRIAYEAQKTQADISRDLGISQATVSSWMVGTRIPRMNKIDLLCHYFNVSRADIMEDHTEKAPPTTVGEVIKQYRMKRGMSTRQFAEMSGISKGYVSMLEANKHPKTGEPIMPSIEKIKQIADAMDMDFNDLLALVDADVDESVIKVPIYGQVAAGIPMEMIEDITDEEEIPKAMGRGGKKYFGLRIKGDSMQPRMRDGDNVIAIVQPTAETGQVVIATVNGDAAVCKRFRQYEDGTIALLSDNPAYAPMVFTQKEVKSLPVKILGVVVELRGKNI